MANLMQRIIEVRKQVDYIQKDKSVSTGGGSYKAVTHDAVTGILREHMNKAGIVCFPALVASASLPKEDGAKQFRYEATYDFTFVNADDPTDRIVIRIEAHAMDNADKAPGKALSYAKKYAMLKLFEIETGEDEESRYQEFDIVPWLELIEKSETIAALNSASEAAKAAIEGQKDHASLFKTLAACKNKRGKELQATAPISAEDFPKAIEAIKAGKFTAEQIKARALTPEQLAEVEALK